MGSQPHPKDLLYDCVATRESFAKERCWTLVYGTAAWDAAAAAFARPSLQDVLTQASGWRLEQQWSYPDRATALQHRKAGLYLIRTVNGQAMCRHVSAQHDRRQRRFAARALRRASVTRFAMNRAAFISMMATA